MPLPGILTIFGVTDGMISRMLTDDASAATYDTAYQVPGIQQCGMDPEMLAKSLYGPDGVLVDVYSKIRGVSGTVSHGRISLDLLSVLLGSTVTDGGTTPSQTKTLAMNWQDITGYFKLLIRMAYNSSLTTGDTNVLYYKCKIKSFKLEFKNEDFATVSFTFDALPRFFDGKILDLIENETAAALVAGAADTTAPTVTCVPADAATGVAVTANIVWTASKSLQATSVNAGTVMLVKASDGTNVAGAVTLANAGAGTTITFNPTANLTGSSEAYIAILTTGVKDLAGNALVAPSVINFTTA